MVNDRVLKLATYYKNGNLAHAYIIQTNDKEACLKDLLTLVKIMSCNKEYKENCCDCNTCYQIENGSFPSLCIVNPDGKNIRKEQIIELRRKMSFKPIFAEFSLYIINDAEKLNASSTNSMLKFLEEPESDIYGFLIVNSKENLLTTIQSRAQVETWIYDSNSYLDSIGIFGEDVDRYLAGVKEYIKVITLEKDKAIMYNKDVLDEFSDRLEIEKLFKIMYNIFHDVMLINAEVKDSLDVDDLDFLLDVNPNKIVEATNIIQNVLESINYNVNLELMLDRFVIEMGEIYG